MNGAGAEDSPCATDVNMIRPWIDGQCEGVRIGGGLSSSVTGSRVLIGASDAVASNPFLTKQSFAQCGLAEEDEEAGADDYDIKLDQLMGTMEGEV